MALDRAQGSADGGPCLQALRAGHIVRAPLGEVQMRWPALAVAASAAGVGSVLSAPLAASEGHPGAINCYAHDQHGFADLDVQLLELYTAAVEAALRAYDNYRRARELAAQLRTAMESRSVIDQAKGILIAVHGIDEQHAFQLLVEQSQQRNVKLRDLAAQFVAQAAATGARSES